MVEIRQLPEGRYEVYAEGRHCEAFEGRFGAIAAALALAGEMSKEIGCSIDVHSPWGASSGAAELKLRHWPARHSWLAHSIEPTNMNGKSLRVRAYIVAWAVIALITIGPSLVRA